MSRLAGFGMNDGCGLTETGLLLLVARHRSS